MDSTQQQMREARLRNLAANKAPVDGEQIDSSSAAAAQPQPGAAGEQRVVESPAPDERPDLRKPKQVEEKKETQKKESATEDALEKAYPNGLGYTPKPYYEAESGTRTRLDLAQLEDQSLKEKSQFFVCAICALVVREPMECSGCQSLICRECIDPWRARNNSCPKKCKGNEEVSFGGVHRYVASELADLRFKCVNEHCNDVNNYHKAIQHLTNCQQLLLPCTLGCGLGILGADMEYHIKKQCENMVEICPECEEPRNPKKPHDCIETLKSALAATRQKYLELESRKAVRHITQNQHADPTNINNAENLQALIQDSEDESVSEYGDDQIRCTNHHVMQQHQGPIQAYRGNPRCDNCLDIDLNLQQFFYHCEHCKSDKCIHCVLCDHDILATNNQMIHGHEHPLQAVSRTSQNSQVERHCANGRNCESNDQELKFYQCEECDVEYCLKCVLRDKS